jgi:hypothetical protein
MDPATPEPFRKGPASVWDLDLISTRTILIGRFHGVVGISLLISGVRTGRFVVFTTGRLL